MLARLSSRSSTTITKLQSLTHLKNYLLSLCAQNIACEHNNYFTPSFIRDLAPKFKKNMVLYYRVFLFWLALGWGTIISALELDDIIDFGLYAANHLINEDFLGKLVRSAEASTSMRSDLEDIKAFHDQVCMIWNSNRFSNKPGYAEMAKYGSGTQIIKYTLSFEMIEKGRWKRTESHGFYALTPTYEIYNSLFIIPSAINRDRVVRVEGSAVQDFIRSTGFHPSVAKAYSPTCDSIRDIVSIHDSDHLTERMRQRKPTKYL
jgi:hypothetical protein